MTLRLLRRHGFALLAFAFDLLLAAEDAFAVANLDIVVTSEGHPLGGATLHLAFPDGAVIERADGDGDGRIAVFLGAPGPYRLTIVLPNGETTKTAFTAPAAGSVMVAYDAGKGPPAVSISAPPARAAGRIDDLHTRPFSFGVYGSYGRSRWNTTADDGAGAAPGEDARLRKWAGGFELRYYLPEIPVFIADRFFWHAGESARDSAFIAAFESEIEVRERWRNQMLFGWHFYRERRVLLTLLGGVSLVRMQMRVNPELSGDVLIAKDHTAAPTFGAEAEVLLHRAMRLYLVAGFTAALMKGLQLEENGVLFRTDSDVQWDFHSGFRVPF